MKKLSLYISIVLFFCNTVQALPKCEGEDYAQWTNCQGTYIDKDVTKSDDKDKFKITRDFTGEFGSIPGQRHGKGFSKVYKDGSLILTYFGEFKDDKPKGQGTEIYLNGAKYVGEWSDGFFNGQGTYSYTNGAKYFGKWKDNKRHGQFISYLIDGAKVTNEYKDGICNLSLNTTIIYPSGDIYIGRIKGCDTHQRHGQGRYQYVSGRVDEGIWKNNELVSDNWASGITIDTSSSIEIDTASSIGSVKCKRVWAHILNIRDRYSKDTWKYNYLDGLSQNARDLYLTYKDTSSLDYGNCDSLLELANQHKK